MNGPKPDRPVFVLRAFWRCLCGRTLSFKTSLCEVCGGEQPGSDAPVVLEDLPGLPANIWNRARRVLPSRKRETV